MGAYGGTWQASKSRRHTLSADLNEDGIVNLQDMGLLPEQWLSEEEWLPEPE